SGIREACAERLAVGSQKANSRRGETGGEILPSPFSCFVSASVDSKGSPLLVAEVIEPELADAVAERRAPDLQQFGGLRLVAAERLERPGDEMRLDFVQAIVERDAGPRGTRGNVGGDDRLALEHDA